jgi:DNA-binding FadR family transcriptional regulator
MTTESMIKNLGMGEGPIQRGRVSDEIVRRLENAIRIGKLSVGDVLPSERELMKLYGVGRPAIREALFTLRKLGLVEVTSGSRTRITLPTAKFVIDELSSLVHYFQRQPDGIQHFQDLRMLFEVMLAREAATRTSKADIRMLKRALDANREAINDRDAFIKTDVGFHRVLAEITRNPIITAIHEAMANWLIEQRVVALMVPDVELVSFQGHRDIFMAVEARDPDRAEREIRGHLSLVAKNYWRAKNKKA